MKLCLKCNTPHEKSGKYCGRSCANSRIFSEESKQKKSIATKRFFSAMTEQERINFSHKRIASHDYNATQAKATEAKRKIAWDKPYEEMSRDSLRKRLLAESNYTCIECGQKANHNNKYLSLEMDHINGDPADNKRENLRILCPNCHSQTSTFRSRNIKTNKVIDIEQLTKLLIKYKFATPALRELGFPNTGSKMRLANEILENLRQQNLI